jgi:MAP3K TRAFs-binding domain
MLKPLCFVLMPFGDKKDENGELVHFDAVYNEIIAPAVKDANLEPIRADEEQVGGLIHKSMFERLLFCDFAVADLTLANPNVFYELGVRHAVRPFSTIPIFASGGGVRLPFDVSPLRSLPYQLSNDGYPMAIQTDREALTKKLLDAKQSKTDSPVFQLIEHLEHPKLDPAKSETFREHINKINLQRETILVASSLEDLHEIEQGLGTISESETSFVILLFQQYRKLGVFEDMVRLVELMSPMLAQTDFVQQQYAFALNRLGQSEKAERALTDLISRRGSSSETLGILGRIYKDRWQKAKTIGEDKNLIQGLLKKAINTYLKGFETDWRDCYPGINALTLLFTLNPNAEQDQRFEQVFPVVQYTVQRNLAGDAPTYWDYATKLELDVLGGNQESASAALEQALVQLKEAWQAATTVANLRFIQEAANAHGISRAWLDQIIESLLKKQNQLQA